MKYTIHRNLTTHVSVFYHHAVPSAKCSLAAHIDRLMVASLLGETCTVVGLYQMEQDILSLTVTHSDTRGEIERNHTNELCVRNYLIEDRKDIQHPPG